MVIPPARLLFRRLESFSGQLDDYFAGSLLVFRRLNGIFAPADRSDDFYPDSPDMVIPII